MQTDKTIIYYHDEPLVHDAKNVQIKWFDDGADAWGNPCVDIWMHAENQDGETVLDGWPMFVKGIRLKTGEKFYFVDSPKSLFVFTHSVDYEKSVDPDWDIFAEHDS